MVGRAVEVPGAVEDQAEARVRAVGRAACEVAEHGVTGAVGPEAKDRARTRRATVAGRTVERPAAVESQSSQRRRPVGAPPGEGVQHGETGPVATEGEHRAGLRGPVRLRRPEEVPCRIDDEWTRENVDDSPTVEIVECGEAGPVGPDREDRPIRSLATPGGCTVQVVGPVKGERRLGFAPSAVRGGVEVVEQRVPGPVGVDSVKDATVEPTAPAVVP